MQRYLPAINSVLLELIFVGSIPTLHKAFPPLISSYLQDILHYGLKIGTQDSVNKLHLLHETVPEFLMKQMDRLMEMDTIGSRGTLALAPLPC